MSASQRASGRFFAAFYRFNNSCGAHKGQNRCLTLARNNGSRLQRIGVSRTFATTRAYRQTSESVRATGEDGQNANLGKGEEEMKRDGTIGKRGVDASTLLPEEPADGSDTANEPTAAKEAVPTKTELRNSMRTLMRNVAYPVVVLTAAAQEPHAGEPLGTAASSFNTVSLDPPTVSFNIRRPSQTLDAIKADEGRFRVHFMASRPKGAHIVEAFTAGNTPKAFLRRKELARMDTSGTVFSKAAHINNEDVMASLQCELTQEMTVGDHVIVVAHVSSVTAKDDASTEPALMYVQGKYIQSDAKTLLHHGTTPRRQKGWEDHVLYNSSPLFLGHRTRSMLKQALKDYVCLRPELFELSPAEATDRICNDLDLPTHPMGLRISGIVRDAALEMGQKLKHYNTFEHDAPTLVEFYGRLSPPRIQSVIEKVIDVVHEQGSQVLTLPFEHAMVKFHMSPSSTGIFASDILNALRDKSLAPLPAANKLPPTTTPTLAHLEQIENQLQAFFLSPAPRNKLQNGNTFASKAPDLWNSSTESLAAAIHAPEWALPWIARIRTRIHIEAFPHFHSIAEYSLSGFLNKYEERIAADRIRRFLTPTTSGTLKERIAMPWWAILRSVNIHPLMSGFDPEFIIARFKYWAKTYSEEEYRTRVSDTFKHHFRGRVTHQDLETLVEDLVKSDVLSAIKWRGVDLLTALKLREHAHYELGTSIPSMTGLKFPKPLPWHQPKNQPKNTIEELVTQAQLVSLLRKAMEKYYDGFSAEEKGVVDAYMADHLQVSEPSRFVRGKGKGVPVRMFLAAERASEESRWVERPKEFAGEEVSGDSGLLEALGLDGGKSGTKSRDGGSGGFTAYGFGGRKEESLQVGSLDNLLEIVGKEKNGDESSPQAMGKKSGYSTTTSLREEEVKKPLIRRVKIRKPTDT